MLAELIRASGSWRRILLVVRWLVWRIAVITTLRAEKRDAIPRGGGGG